MESQTSVVLKLAAIAVISFVLSIQTFAQEKQDIVLNILKLNNDLVIHESDIQYHGEGDKKQPFVAFQGGRATLEEVNDKPYCHLWINKTTLTRKKPTSITIEATHTKKAKTAIIVNEKPEILPLEASIHYKSLTHPWLSEIFCKNITKIEETKDVVGASFTEAKATFRQNKKDKKI